MRVIQSVNDNWLFHKVQPDQEWQTVNLPHTYNAVDGQDGSPMYRGPVEYKKTISVEMPSDQVHYLEVGAASLASEVFVNGVSCYKTSCGFSLYRVKLDDYLKNGENEILFKITNGSTAKLYPAMADFSFYGGLYRGVKLVTEDKLHFKEDGLSRDGIVLMPEVGEDGKGRLRVIAEAVNEEDAAENAENTDTVADAFTGKITCRTEVVDASGQVVAADEKTGLAAAAETFELSLEIPDVHLWDGLADPYLYTVVASLIDEDGNVQDERRLMTGFRTIEYDPEEGLKLNGKQIKLNGVARHQDFAGVGNAVTPETMAIDMKLIQEIGTNSLRCSHYQHPDEWYDLCDRYGLLVWAEVPVISVIAQNPDADQNAFDQLDRLIAQARNHCCIYCWGVQNEVCMGSNNAYTYDLVDRLAKHAKELDPSRMTAQANEYTTQNDCPILKSTDISGHNLYYGWYYGNIPELQGRLDAIHETNPEKPMILTEYGVDTNVQFHTTAPKANDYTEEYQLMFHENALKAIDERTFMIGGYVWNMFDFGSAGRDEGGTKGKNQKGLVTIDRKTKKDAFYLYKAHWSKEPFVYVAGRRFVNRPQNQDGDTETTITVISNMDQLQLNVNGTAAAGCLSSGDMIRFEHVELLPGENTIEAIGSNADGTTRVDRIMLRSVAEPDPSYVLKAKEKVVVDWFAGLDNEEFGIADTPIRPEGFSYADIIQDIYDNDRARDIFLKFLRPLTLNARFECMKPFTTVNQLLHFANRNGEIPEKLLKHCEQELNKIDK